MLKESEYAKKSACGSFEGYLTILNVTLSDETENIPTFVTFFLRVFCDKWGEFFSLWKQMSLFHNFSRRNNFRGVSQKYLEIIYTNVSK